MERLDMDAVDRCVDRALDLLRRTYRGGEGGIGGWYHSLESATPGPSATGVGLSSFLIHRRPFEHRDECLRFLRERQVSSADPMRDGGWAVNTSFGQPITEVTGLVSRLLVTTRLVLDPDAPDAGRASRWLVHNQNADGGWGSFRQQESRVWLTAMAVRALAELQPHSAALRTGVEWLLRGRDAADGAWGELPSRPPTVTHTSYVLTALVDTGLARRDHAVMSAIRRGFEWLSSHLDPDAIHDDRARVESYNVTAVPPDGTPVTFHSTVWHHGLPFAIAALARHPDGGRFDLLYRAVQTVLAHQLADGGWPPLDSAAASSVWSVWPFIEALHDVQTRSPFTTEDAVTYLSPSVLLVQRGSDRERTTGQLLRRYRTRRWWRQLRRAWAAVTLVLFLVVGLLLVVWTPLGWGEFAMGLVVPIALLVVQWAAARSGR